MLLPDNPVLTFKPVREVNKTDNIQNQNEKTIKTVSPVTLAVRPMGLAVGITNDIIPEGIVVYTKEEYEEAIKKNGVAILIRKENKI